MGYRHYEKYHSPKQLEYFGEIDKEWKDKIFLKLSKECEFMNCSDIKDDIKDRVKNSNYTAPNKKYKRKRKAKNGIS